MLIAVTKFNKERNGLELNFNNELNMLREEIKEFWDATTAAERVDAFVDTEYVWLGTQVKCSFNTFAIPNDMEKGVQSSLTIMERYLMEELPVEKYHKIIDNAREIVCSANAEKGKNLDKDGKVTKEGFKRDATAEIAAMIKEVIDNG